VQEPVQEQALGILHEQLMVLPGGRQRGLADKRAGRKDSWPRSELAEGGRL